MRRALIRTTDLLLPLAVLAALLALLVPSQTLAERSDLVLAALVLFTALGIAPAQLLTLRERKAELAALVFVPFVFLVPLAWLVSQPFEAPVSDGVLALGVSSTEVAAVGLVALAGGSAVLALGALTGSLVVAALAGPVLLGLFAGAGADVNVGELIGRFSLVVLLPLAAGLAVRARIARLREVEGELAGLATVALVALVYGAMSGPARAENCCRRPSAVPCSCSFRAYPWRPGGRLLPASCASRGTCYRAARLRGCGSARRAGVRAAGSDRRRCIRPADAASRRRRRAAPAEAGLAATPDFVTAVVTGQLKAVAQRRPKASITPRSLRLTFASLLQDRQRPTSKRGRLNRASSDGRGWARTSDLSRVSQDEDES